MVGIDETARLRRRGMTAGLCTAFVMVGIAAVFRSQLVGLPWYWLMALGLLAVAVLRGIVSAASKSRDSLIVAYPEALFKGGQFEKALQVVEQVITRSPGNAEAYYLKGQCHDRLGQTKSADEAWKKALELNPQHARAAHDLACDLMNLGAFLQAATYLAQARKAGAQSVEAGTFQKNVDMLKQALITKGLEAEKARQFDIALQYADAIVGLVPDFAIGHAWRAKQRVNVGQYRDAIEDARECLRLDPTYTKANSVIQEAERRLNQAVAEEQLAAQASGGSSPRNQTNATPRPTPGEPTRMKPRRADPTLIKPPGAGCRVGDPDSRGTLWEVGERVFERQAIEIRRIVQTGGMGTVYYAWNHDSSEPLAMKTVRLNAPGAPVNEGNLRQEAERWLSLGKHPRIVTLYGVEKVDYRYLVLLMEYVAGQPDIGPTLADHLRIKGRLDAPEAARIGLGICEAMEFAHTRQRMVHRDLKPANVFLTSAGQVKVGDFGLAGSDGRPMGEFAGTPEYAAPEQWKPSCPLKPSMDVYALGVILYEALAGQRPILLANEDAHASPDVKVALLGKLHAQQNPVALLSLCPGLPQEFGEFIEQCLSKDPSERPCDWQKLCLTLAGFAGDVTPPEITAPHVEPGDIGDDAYSKGVTADAMGKNEEALACYQKAVQKEPYRSQRAEAWANMAKVLGQMGRYQESAKAAEKALSIDAKDLVAMQCLGNVLSEMESYAKAINVFDRLLAQAPEKADAHAARGRALLRSGQIEAATAAYSRATELDPKLHYAWSGLGMCAEATGDLDSGLAMFDRAIELYEGFADAHEGRAQILTAMGKDTEAVEAHRQALHYDPSNAVFATNLGIGLANLGRYADALPPLQQAIGLDPMNGLAHLALARVCGELGRYNEAVRWALRANELGQPEGLQVAEMARNLIQHTTRTARGQSAALKPPMSAPPPVGPKSGSTHAGPGRNDPCPCGSGRKYKACCGRPSDKQATTKPAKVRGRPASSPHSSHAGIDQKLMQEVLRKNGINVRRVLLMPDGPAKKSAMTKILGEARRLYEAEVAKRKGGDRARLGAGGHTGSASSAGRKRCVCGVDNPPANTFCLACGKRLPVAKAEGCPRCGKPVPPGARFCVHCGREVAGR